MFPVSQCRQVLDAGQGFVLTLAMTTHMNGENGYMEMKKNRKT